MPVVGSPEWFHEKSQTEDMQNWMRTVEEKREIFLDRFSPEKLMAMIGSELLLNVFGNDPSSMMRLLMFDREYRWFGASGTYAYLGVVFYDGENWKYNEKNNYTALSLSQAEEKADDVRDQIINCVDEIKNYGIFKTVQDYKKLQERLENKVFFYQYQWAMKYYQMLFPQYFPGMYVDKGFLARACYILGLPDHGNRFLNAGQVSLFIRNCDINNIVFNKIYSTEWGWSGDVRPCPNATVNYENSFKPVETINLEYYRLSTRKEKMAEHAVQIEKEIENLGLKGQEREAVIKARVNQGIFRDLLLKRYHNCCLCRISDPQLLVASHIKPWSKSNPEEKLDPGNGFILCPAHDKLFDLGLISFEDDGQIIISSELSEVDQVYTNTRQEMKIEVREDNKPFLQYHRENIFRG